MTGFLEICHAAEPEAAIAAMTDEALLALHHFLTTPPIVTTGIPGLIADLVFCEAAQRFLTPQQKTNV